MGAPNPRKIYLTPKYMPSHAYRSLLGNTRENLGIVRKKRQRDQPPGFTRRPPVGLFSIEPFNTWHAFKPWELHLKIEAVSKLPWPLMGEEFGRIEIDLVFSEEDVDPVQHIIAIRRHGNGDMVLETTDFAKAQPDPRSRVF